MVLSAAGLLLKAGVGVGVEAYSFFDTDFSGLFGMLKLVLMTAISRVSKPSNHLFHPKSKWFGYKTMQMCMCVCFLYLMLEMWGDPPALLLLDVM